MGRKRKPGVVQPQKFNLWNYYLSGVAYGTIEVSDDYTPEEAFPHVRNLAFIRSGLETRETDHDEFLILPTNSQWGLLLYDRGQQEGLPRRDSR